MNLDKFLHRVAMSLLMIMAACIILEAMRVAAGLAVNTPASTSLLE